MTIFRFPHSGKRLHKTTCTHNWLVFTVLFCSVVGFLKRVLGLATAQAFTSFGAHTKWLLVWLRGGRVPSSHTLREWDILYDLEAQAVPGLSSALSYFSEILAPKTYDLWGTSVLSFSFPSLSKPCSYHSCCHTDGLLVYIKVSHNIQSFKIQKPVLLIISDSLIFIWIPPKLCIL